MIQQLLPFVIHLIIHELGHFVFGKFTGYTFVSFRIFSFIWIKIDENIVFRRFYLPGTIGQCLMRPPELAKNERPFKLYILGGGLLNLIVSGLVLGVALLFNVHSVYILSFIAAGFLTAAVNLIPTGINDGMLLKKSWNAGEMQRLLYNQLIFNALTTNGTRYQEINSDLIKIPEQLDYHNVWQLWPVLAHYNRAIEAADFQKAKEIIDDLWKNIDKKSFYLVEIAKEWIFCQLYFNVNHTEVTSLFNEKNVKTSLSTKMMNNLRIKAMYEWKINNNYQEARKLFNEGLNNTKYQANEADLLYETDLIMHCLQSMNQQEPLVSMTHN